MFHVEPSSAKLYQSHERILKQRNFLLKSKQHDSLALWNDKLVEANNLLAKVRHDYFLMLNEEFNKIIKKISERFPVLYKDISSLELHFYRGWENDVCYEDSLKNSITKDAKPGLYNCWLSQV